MTVALQRVLYVEDDPSIQLVARIALEQVGGFDVLSCRSGQEALDRVSDFRPQLALLDVMMPGMDGPRLMTALRALPGLEALPVIFITAKAEPAEHAALMAGGAEGVILKPFDPLRLAEQVREHWYAQQSAV